MKRIEIPADASKWRVVASTVKSQAAIMIIAPGDREGGPRNRHTSDQWLFVIGGRGSATVGDEEVALAPGVIVLIEAGETHEVRADAGDQLRTINIYAPSAYS
jgi:mannose-6-phosphate isomerase-like protein (cupin superfamily)